MSNQRPDDAKITPDELRALKRGNPKSGNPDDVGDYINVYLRDIDGVISRGEVVRGVQFLGWFPADADGKELPMDQQQSWYHNPDMRSAFVHAQVDSKEALALVPEDMKSRSRVKLPVYCGFHGWLIERIQVIAVDYDEIEKRIETWHRDQQELDVELHDYLGWTWEQYGRHVEDPDYIPYVTE